MNELMKILLSLSFSGTLLILILLLFRPLYKERLSKSWQYYIWLVIVFRLLIPWTPEISLVGILFQQTDSNTKQFDTPSTNFMQTQNVNIDRPTFDEPTQPRELSSFQSSPRPLDWILENIWLIWFFVALILLIRKITIYQSFVKYIKADCSEIEDIDQLEQFGKIIEQQHIKNVIALYTNDLISSPLLLGFFRPCIVLTNVKLSDNDFYYTILHELTHYKRFDMFYKWLVQFTICIHWFNPFVYIMAREINHICELSCDEAVIRKLDEKSRRAYGDTLLNAVAAEKGNYKNSLVSVTLNESKELLKGRLDAIMKYHKKSKRTIIAMLLFTVLFSASAVVFGAYAAPAEDGKESSESTSIRDRMLQEGGTYYIFCDGTNEADKPMSGSTKGAIQLVLVYKDGYVSIAPLEDIHSLVEDVEHQCNNMIEHGTITEDEKNLFIEAAKEIQSHPPTDQESLDDENKTHYMYRQDIYYHNSYIFGVGWNLHEDDARYYTSKKITLSDNSVLLVFFDDSCIEQMRKIDAMEALSELLEDLKAKYQNDSYPLEIPFVVDIEYVGDQDIYTLAEQYYKEEELPRFIALFPMLDKSTQEKYLDNMFNMEEIAFFSASLDHMESDNSLIAHYAERAYQADELAFFSVLSENMDETTRQEWIERASYDNEIAYLSVLSDNWDDNWKNDWLDNWNDEWDDESDTIDLTYIDSGITEDDGIYYYQGERVCILIDLRPDHSFKNFFYDAKGTINLRLIRSETDEITRVEYLTEDEANAILGDMIGPSFHN